jgi:hypothetical protein
MKDAQGDKVTTGDFVVDERGKAWRLEDTPPTIAASLVAYGTVVHSFRGKLRDGDPHKMVRLVSVYKVDVVGTQAENRETYRKMRASASSDAARAAISERRNGLRRAY